MKRPIDALKNIWSQIKSADHLQGEWDARDFALDPAPATPGMNHYPILVVNARREAALATLEWMPAQLGSHAYVLATRRIHH